MADLTSARYTQSMTAIRQGVKKLEDTLEEEKIKYRMLQSSMADELEIEQKKSRQLAQELRNTVANSMGDEIPKVSNGLLLRQCFDYSDTNQS